VLCQHAGDFLQRQAVLIHRDELMKQLRLLTAQPALQRNQQAVQMRTGPETTMNSRARRSQD
jgi:hypothetical protein